MTRSELYLALTEALAAAKPIDGSCDTACCDQKAVDQWEVDCGHIATAMGTHHKGFDRERFLRECGVQS